MPHGRAPRGKKRQPRPEPVLPESPAVELPPSPPPSATEISAKARRAPRRCNDLGGRDWVRNSLSVWGDLRKSLEEYRLSHPALYPAQLADRLIASFLPAGAHLVLDPFAGVGSTLLAAVAAGKQGIGFEVSPEFYTVARSRLQEQIPQEEHASPSWILHGQSAKRLRDFLPENSVDLCITSPPYWDILQRQRTADFKSVRNYGNHALDLGTIADYGEFLTALCDVFQDVLAVLKPGAHCCIVVMDLRKRDRFYPLHADLASRLRTLGFVWDDLVIWNRQAEYNNLRPLGYPAVFRINKVHEYILLMQKPRLAGN